jgi:hypothetical protein
MSLIDLPNSSNHLAVLVTQRLFQIPWFVVWGVVFFSDQKNPKNKKKS